MVILKRNDERVDRIRDRNLNPFILFPIIVWAGIIMATIVFRLIRPDHPERTVLPLTFAVVALIAVTLGLIFGWYYLVASGLVISLGSPTVIVWYVWPGILLLTLIVVVRAVGLSLSSSRSKHKS